jgi:hypothetical protein
MIWATIEPRLAITIIPSTRTVEEDRLISNSVATANGTATALETMLVTSQASTRMPSTRQNEPRTSTNDRLIAAAMVSRSNTIATGAKLSVVYRFQAGQPRSVAWRRR